jgi:hypothetical protein
MGILAMMCPKTSGGCRIAQPMKTTKPSHKQRSAPQTTPVRRSVAFLRTIMQLTWSLHSSRGSPAGGYQTHLPHD